jgi:hypothetical protein
MYRNCVQCYCAGSDLTRGSLTGCHFTSYFKRPFIAHWPEFHWSSGVALMSPSVVNNNTLQTHPVEMYATAGAPHNTFCIIFELFLQL